MQTVMRIGALRVVIFPNDHRPSHVHVVGAEGEAVYNLRCPDGPPELRENFGLKRSDVGGVKDALAAELSRLCAEWSAIQGDF